MRTTVTLDDDVFEAASALAAGSGKRLGQVISQLARKGLKAEPRVAEKNGLPVFVVPADAPVIPGNRAGELLSDEEP